jgi:hypothetical protein
MWTSEYYKYCLRLLIDTLEKTEKSVNVILGAIDCSFDNDNKVLRLDIQSEHTLVKLGGRSVGEIIYGDIDLMDEDGKYLIRIPNYEYYKGLDATIEYSLPNIANIQSGGKYTEYLETATYIAPVIYNQPSFEARDRTMTITMFSDNPCDRRDLFVERSGRMQLGVCNIQRIFSKNDLKRVYHESKIMVNVHQTDHHHTLEELRVLPALCNGVIIVSEDVPLKDKIPYAGSIVWSSYDNLTKTIKEVQDNYEDFYYSLFTEALKAQLIELRQNSFQNFRNLIDKIG